MTPTPKDIYDALKWALQEISMYNYSLEDIEDMDIQRRVETLKYLMNIHKPPGGKI